MDSVVWPDLVCGSQNVSSGWGPCMWVGTHDPPRTHLGPTHDRMLNCSSQGSNPGPPRRLGRQPDPATPTRTVPPPTGPAWAASSKS